MKTWKHSGFKVWLGEDICHENQEQRLFISRYLAKCPLSLERIEITESALAPAVRYYKDAEKDGEFIEVSPLEFLARLATHVPLPHERTTRLFGLYSYRTRGAKNRKAKFRAWVENNLEPLQPQASERPKASRYWACFIKKVYEVDPLMCDKCGAQMKVRAFIHDPKKIIQLTKDLGIQDWRAPPQLEKAASTFIDKSSEFNQEN